MTRNEIVVGSSILGILYPDTNKESLGFHLEDGLSITHHLFIVCWGVGGVKGYDRSIYSYVNVTYVIFPADT